MRTRHKRILLLLQLAIVGVLVFAISGIIGFSAYLLGQVSVEELITYFEGLLTGESLVIGGTFLKISWKKIVDDFWDWIEGNDEPELVSKQKIAELKKMLRRKG
jgi:hypothetical protein